MATQYKDRVQKLIRLKPSQIDPDERNPRMHPTGQQAALREGLTKLGVWDAVIVRKVGKRYKLVDGHLRREQLDQPIPALVVDLDEHEAAQALATGDAIGGLAEFDEGKLRALVREFETGPATRAMLAELVTEPLDFAGFENPDDRPSGAADVIRPPPVPIGQHAGDAPANRMGDSSGSYLRIGDYEGAVPTALYARFDALMQTLGGIPREQLPCLFDAMVTLYENRDR